MKQISTGGVANLESFLMSQICRVGVCFFASQKEEYRAADDAFDVANWAWVESSQYPHKR